jgi:hypothetical protein
MMPSKEGRNFLSQNVTPDLTAHDEVPIFASFANQGDQIGRIFADGAIVFFGYIFKNLGLLFSTRQVMYVLVLTKTGLATL